MFQKQFISTTFILFLSFVFNTSGIGQASYMATSYDVKDGLNTSYGRYLQKDSRGFIWFASENGLHRYDGNSVHVFKHRADDPLSIISNNCNGIFQDSKKQLWINTDEGLSLFDEKRQAFENYKVEASNFSFLSIEYTDMAEDHAGRIWIGGNHDILIFDVKTKKFTSSGWFDYAKKNGLFLREKRNSITHSIKYKSESEFWLLTVYGLFSVNTRSMKFQYYPNENIEEYFAFNISHIDKTGKLWITTYDQCFYTYDPSVNKWTHHKCPPQDKSVSNNVLNIDYWAGDTILCTNYKGCWKYNIVSQKYYYVEPKLDREKYSPPYSFIKYLDGDFYLFKKDPNTFIHLAKHEPFFSKRKLPLPYDFQSNHAYSIKNNRVLVGDWDRGEVIICDKKECVPILDQNGLRKIGNLQLHYESKAGRHYFSTSDKVYIYDEQNNKSFGLKIIGNNEKVKNHELRNFVEDRVGNIYVRDRYQGIYKIDHKNESINYMELGLDESNYSALYYDQLMDKLWLATEKSGIYKIDLSTLKIKNYPIYSMSNSKKGFINDICGDSLGNVYLLLVGQGIVHITSKTMKHTLYTSSNGLNSELVSFGFIDKKGFFWFTTYLGLNAFDFRTQRFYNFENNSDANLFTYRLFGENDDKLFQNIFPNQLISFETNRLLQDYNVKSIYLKELKLFGKVLTHQKEYLFENGQNNLDFSFGYLGGNSLQKIRFQYRLNDQPWQDLDNMKISMYNLSSSKYKLEIRQKYKDIVGLSIGFEILPAWWETWWFYTLLFSIIAAILIRYNRKKIIKIRNEAAKKNELNQKIAHIEMSALRAQMNPHFIFNCLSSINRYILTNDNEKASDYLTKFSKLIRLILDESNENYITLAKEIQSLQLYLEMESMRFQESFEWNISIAEDVNINQIMIPTLLLQPYVENAIWHGFMQAPSDWGVKKIEIRIWEMNHNLIIEITDNGIGIGIENASKYKTRTVSTHKSYGISLNQNRLQLMKQLQGIDVDVKITNRSDEGKDICGTKVKIIINQKEKI